MVLLSLFKGTFYRANQRDRTFVPKAISSPVISGIPSAAFLHSCTRIRAYWIPNQFLLLFETTVKSQSVWSDAFLTIRYHGNGAHKYSIRFVTKWVPRFTKIKIQDGIYKMCSEVNCVAFDPFKEIKEVPELKSLCLEKMLTSKRWRWWW